MHLGFNGRLLIFVSNTYMVASAYVDHSARPPPCRKNRRVLSPWPGNDRETSNSIETSDAAAKKLGDQFFEKLAAIFGSTPELGVLSRPPTNQRGVVRVRGRGAAVFQPLLIWQLGRLLEDLQ
jgi:hypothetical protein